MNLLRTNNITIKKMRPNFKILDGLRGIAATYVLIHHSRGQLLMGGNEYAKIVPLAKWSISDKLYYSALQLTSFGREFVILFFVLSGFSIAYSLQTKSPILSFYSRRLIRLYPPYILALIWAAIVYYISSKISPIFTAVENSVFDSFSSTISNLLYIPKGAFIGQFWTLTHEVIFYLLIPFLILNKNLYYISSFLFFCISFFYGWQQITGSNLITMHIFDYNIFFAVGVWLFYNYGKVEKAFFIVNNKVFYTTSITIFLLLILLKFKLGEYNKISLVFAVFFTFLIIVNFLKKEIHNKVLSFLGTMSYTLYITHLASIYIFKSLLFKFGFIDSTEIRTWYIWIIGVFISLGLSFIFYYLAERPTKIFLKNTAKRNK